MSSVSEFYRDKTVFVTGATGFLGSCLIEKLLRCCEVKNIYVLMRPKKGKSIEERLQDLKKDSVFEKLTEQGNDEVFKKIIPVAGDVSEDGLGLSTENKQNLVKNVEIVFHSAATLDFDVDLKTTVNINLLGTRRVVQFCNEIETLKALVHVSSAYVNSCLSEVNETLYPAPMNVAELLKLVEQMDDQELIEATPKILDNHVNPYTFTKHLAEHEIANSGLPATIVRPSMITGAWKEPVPGWTTSKNGPQGFLMGAGKGVVRRLPMAKHLVYDYIPVDIVVNSLLVAAFAMSRDSSKKLTIYHCTSSTCNPFKWELVTDKIDIFLHKYPLKSAVWYPTLKFLPSLFLFRISAFFFHMIPAYILDFVTMLAGGRKILVRMHTNINNSLGRLEKFIFSSWKFYNPRMLELHESLSKEDQEKFLLDIRSLQWDDYFMTLTWGVRTYLNKESPKSLEAAKSKDRMLMFAHLGLQATILGLVWWLAKIFFATTWGKAGFAVSAIYILFSYL